MEKQLTITLPDDVYEGLKKQVGAGNMSKFIEDLLRPIVASDDALEAAYREMAADQEREHEAMEWIEANVDDALE